MWKLEVDNEVNSRHSLARVDCACEVSFLAALPCVMPGVQRCRPFADYIVHVEMLFPGAPRRVIFALCGSPKTLQVQLRVRPWMMCRRCMINRYFVLVASVRCKVGCRVDGRRQSSTMHNAT